MICLQPKLTDKPTVEHKLELLSWLFGTLNIDWQKDEETFDDSDTQSSPLSSSSPPDTQPLSPDEHHIVKQPATQPVRA